MNLILLASGGFEPCEMCYNMICETRNRTEMYDIYPYYNPSGCGIFGEHQLSDNWLMD